MTKSEQTSQSALAAVADAVRAAHEASGEAAMLEPSPDPMAEVEDFGKLSAEPILKYCEAAAVHVERCGTEVFSEGEKLQTDCIQLANDIRRVALQQAQAIRAQTNRTRKAAMALSRIRDEFHNDIERELAELEKLKATVGRIAPGPVRPELEAEAKAKTG